MVNHQQTSPPFWGGEITQPVFPSGERIEFCSTSFPFWGENQVLLNQFSFLGEENGRLARVLLNHLGGEIEVSSFRASIYDICKASKAYGEGMGQALKVYGEGMGQALEPYSSRKASQ